MTETLPRIDSYTHEQSSNVGYKMCSALNVVENTIVIPIMIKCIYIFFQI